MLIANSHRTGSSGRSELELVAEVYPAGLRIETNLFTTGSNFSYILPI